MSTIKGACNCGAITVEIAAADFPTVSGFCHCLDCRASSGSLFVPFTSSSDLFAINMPIAPTALKVNGTPKVFSRKADSGRTCHRNFCGDCGSAIFTRVPEIPGNLWLKGGLFKQFGVNLPKAGMELYIKNREKWEGDFEGMMTLPAYLPDTPPQTKI